VDGQGRSEALVTSIDFAQIGSERANYEHLFDPVTGLPTGWVLLIDRIEVGLARCRRTGSLVAVFVLDRPHLPEERFGGVVERIRRQLRSDDTLAKIGPDRLVIVCTDVADDAEAAGLARHIINEAGVICSLGVALGGADDTSADLLFRGVRAATEVILDLPE
jgi:GGDEF domain-containing protein